VERPEIAAETADLIIANTLATEMLLPSFVADIGHFGGSPTIRFANDRLTSKVWLSIDATFELHPEPNLPVGLTPRQRDLLTLDAIYGLVVESVRCSANGSLSVRFADGSALSIAGSGDESSEPWTIRTDDGKMMLVACSGGGYAVWNL
jgi:hypothetical protein